MIVLDSGVLVAYQDRDDAHHAEAFHAIQSLADGVWGKGLLLEYVFLEVVSVLKRARGAQIAVEVATYLRRAHQFELVPSSDLFRDVMTEFQSDLLTPMGFTDTAVAVLARQRAGGKVLTFDPVFRKVPGITVLPA